MTSSGIIELVAGDLAVRVAPDMGGTISAFERRAGAAVTPILKGIDESALEMATADRAACFPMVPFANRAPGNVLRAGAATFDLTANTAEPNALHGCGWQRAWRMAGRDTTTLVMRLDATDYPFTFRSEQTIALTPAGLTIGISLTNTHRDPIPAGLGLHPYFPRTAATTLRFTAPLFWLEGPGYLPTDAITTPPELDFSWDRPIPDRWRNNCYSRWDGHAEIGQPDHGYKVQLTASPLFRDVMLFTPPGADSFAFEPQSHTTAATDTASLIPSAQPLARLLPGETISGELRLDIQLL